MNLHLSRALQVGKCVENVTDARGWKILRLVVPSVYSPGSHQQSIPMISNLCANEPVREVDCILVRRSSPVKCLDGGGSNEQQQRGQESHAHPEGESHPWSNCARHLDWVKKRLQACGHSPGAPDLVCSSTYYILQESPASNEERHTTSCWPI
jgi:hypothetical protein